ncbi:hypothetical protein [Reichenbachiella ulvae]|uniref:Outer membrane protein beta-barrel domain-containing protein n=1 Tax=Reichenbachiella ulvae TaxID=2980104 RepID=A0ABT3CYQ9_9BACT|nr:hypothetical protein [Reichenbachiella ulvae]MCV9388688.1 hypothetical protein [Reichenbachiella ulvae]
MKKTILLILSVVVVSMASAQNYVDDKDEVKSLINKDNELSPFISLDFKTGNTVDQLSLLVGAHGGILVNKNVILGVGTYGWVTDPKVTNASQVDLELNGGYAGLLLGYKLFPKEIIHLNFPVLIGGGQIRLDDTDFFQSGSNDNSYTLEQSGFFIVDPCAQIEMNISHNFRVAVGAGYRFVIGSGVDTVTDEDLSDLYGMLSIQLGRF